MTHNPDGSVTLTPDEFQTLRKTLEVAARKIAARKAATEAYKREMAKQLADDEP